MPPPTQAPDGAKQRLEATVATLRKPESYPDTVETVEAIETHMAWVFLTEEHAYKLKKPLLSRLIDYTTIEGRRTACEAELELNRRLAAPVYLDVLPLTLTEVGGRVGGDGPPIDWLIKMRRLPDHRMLEARIEYGTVRRSHIDRLVAKLSEFYVHAEPIGWSADEYRSRIEANISAKRSSIEQSRYGLSTASIRSVVSKQARWFEQHKDLLGSRADRVIDAHGDLRPEHVYLDEEPLIIDCLEFSRRLRLLDPVSELSFLGLECRRLGAPWIGERLLERYKKHTGDEFADALIPFYQSYHALIRAAITIWHLDDPATQRADYWRDRAEGYLAQARRVL